MAAANNNKQEDDRTAGRLTFQENMRLLRLPDRKVEDGKVVKRYMSARAAWRTGCDLPFPKSEFGPGKKVPIPGNAAFGGHVYAQAALAASDALRERLQERDGEFVKKREYGIHTVHGNFSEAGLTDRPFVYEVTTIATNPAFQNLLVVARQPRKPALSGTGDDYTPADAEQKLGPVCFNSLVSFRPAGLTQLDTQEPSVQSRFAAVLRQRPPSAWDYAPLTDVESVMAALPPGHANLQGSFPAIEMRKVDMRAFNRGRPVHEQRQLILYRLIAPLAADDANAHTMLHAFGADRNGVLMVADAAGFGSTLAKAASLSYAFVVHVNARDAVMEYRRGGGDELSGWWVQEVTFPRVGAGRCVLLTKIWSPAGVHVATEYQDGLLRRMWRPGELEGKL